MSPELLQRLLADYRAEAAGYSSEELQASLEVNEQLASGQMEMVTYEEGDIPYYQACADIARDLLDKQEAINKQACEDNERMQRGN